MSSYLYFNKDFILLSNSLKKTNSRSSTPRFLAKNRDAGGVLLQNFLKFKKLITIKTGNA